MNPDVMEEKKPWAVLTSRVRSHILHLENQPEVRTLILETVHSPVQLNSYTQSHWAVGLLM